MNCLIGIKDPYLLTNIVAILMDLAPNLRDISAYTAERIVSVTKRLTRRYIMMMVAINKRRSIARKHKSLMTTETIGHPRMDSAELPLQKMFREESS